MNNKNNISDMLEPIALNCKNDYFITINNRNIEVRNRALEVVRLIDLSYLTTFYMSIPYIIKTIIIKQMDYICSQGRYVGYGVPIQQPSPFQPSGINLMNPVFSRTDTLQLNKEGQRIMSIVTGKVNNQFITKIGIIDNIEGCLFELLEKTLKILGPNIFNDLNIMDTNISDYLEDNDFSPSFFNNISNLYGDENDYFGGEHEEE